MGKDAKEAKSLVDSKIVLKIDAIETPRGLVPTISSIESLVNAINKILSELFNRIERIMTLLENNSKCIKDITLVLNGLKLRMEFIENLLSEIKVYISEPRREDSVRDVGQRKKDIKKELLDMIGSNAP